MSLLRRRHAHRRDIPPWADTDVAAPTQGAGRMTDRLSQIINPRWLLHAGPAQATCADQVSARSQTTIHPARRTALGDWAGKPKSAASCKRSNSPLKPPSHRPSAHFTHSITKTLAASTLGGFPTRVVRPPIPHPHAATRIRKPSPERPFISIAQCCTCSPTAAIQPTY